MFFIKIKENLIGFIKYFFWKFKLDNLNKYDLIVTISEESFGHKITILDYISRLYKNNKIFIFFLTNKNINKFHINLYKKYINFKIIKFNGSKDQISGFKKILNFNLKKNFRTSYISEPTLLYKVLKNDNLDYEIYDSEINKKVKNHTFFSHDYILENKKFNLNLVLEDEEIFEEKLKIISKIQNPKIFGYLFRREKKSFKNLHDNIRDAGPIENYMESIDFILHQDKNNLVLIDDKNLPYIENKRIINIRAFDEELYYLANIFMLKKSKFCVMQHSGPLHLANILNTPLVVTDFLPLWQGSCGKNDIFVPKNFISKTENKIISLKDIILNYKELFYGNYNLYTDIKITPSKKENISSAVKELYYNTILNGLDNSGEMNINQNNYLSLLPKNSIYFLRKNKLSQSILKRDFK